MTSPMKRSGSKSGVAGPASGNKSKVNNENDEPTTKGIEGGTTRPPPVVDVLTLRMVEAGSSITPSHPNLEQSMLSIEATNQSVPNTKKRTKSVRFALDKPRMQPPRTPKARSKKRLIRFEDHPGLSELEIGALRAARIMTMPSPPKFGAPDYDSDSSEEEEDTINFMSRRPTRMKPSKVSAPPAERSSGNIFARNGNIFAPIQAPSEVQAWPVGSYKAAMAIERAKKAEEKARREEEARKEAEQKAQDENAKRDAEEEAAVVQMLESSPMQSSEELPEASTDAPEDVLDEAPTEAPQDPQPSTNEQADDMPEPKPAALLSLCPSPPPPPPPQSHQPVSAAPESQLFPARYSKQALDNIAEEDAAEDTVEGTMTTEDEEDWVIVDTPEPQPSSPEPSTQARRSPTIPQVMQRVTRSMSNKIQAKLRVISGSKNKPEATGSKTSKASRGAAKARQIFKKAKPAGLARTQTRTVSAAESRAQTTPPTIPKVRTTAIDDAELALTASKPTSVADSEPTASRPKRNQLKRRWMDDDVQETSSTKRKLSGQAPPAKKAKLSSMSKVPVAVPQGPTVPTSQEAIPSPRVSEKRRRDADEEEDSSIGVRLVKRLRRL